MYAMLNNRGYNDTQAETRMKELIETASFKKANCAITLIKTTTTKQEKQLSPLITAQVKNIFYCFKPN